MNGTNFAKGFGSYKLNTYAQTITHHIHPDSILMRRFLHARK